MKGIIKDIIQSFKDDYQALKDTAKRLEEGRGLFPEWYKQKLKEEVTVNGKFSIRKLLKENYLDFLFIFLALLCGFIWGNKEASDRANQFILDNYVYGDMCQKVGEMVSSPGVIDAFNITISSFG